MTTEPAAPAAPGDDFDLTDPKVKAFTAKWRAQDHYRIPRTPAVRAAMKVIGDAIRRTLPAACGAAAVSVTVWSVTADGERDMSFEDVTI